MRPNNWPAKSRILPGLRALKVPTAIPITTPKMVPIRANSIVTGKALAVSEAIEIPVEYEYPILPLKKLCIQDMYCIGKDLSMP